MFNFRDSNGSLRRNRHVALAATVAREGMLLVRTMEDGIEKVSPCAAAASQVPVGFSVLDNETFATDVAVEVVSVPASPGPYTVQLSNANIAGSGPASFLIGAIVVGGSALVQNAGVAAGQFSVTSAGLMTFNAAQAGSSVSVTYRFTLTSEQAQQRGLGNDTSDGGPGTRSVNNWASSLLRQCTVLSGNGEVYTKEFDVTVTDWTTGTLSTAADGTVTMGGGGTSIAANCRVIKVPDSNDAHLGLAFNFTA